MEEGRRKKRRLEIIREEKGGRKGGREEGRGEGES